MDSIYSNCSQPVNIRKIFPRYVAIIDSKCSESTFTAIMHEKFRKDLQWVQSLQIQPDVDKALEALVTYEGDFEDLHRSIDLSLLESGSDPKVVPLDLAGILKTKRDSVTITVPKEALELKCVRKRMEEMANLPCYMRNKTNKYRSTHFIEPREPLPDDEWIAPLSEVVITFRFFGPAKLSQYEKVTVCLDRDIKVLGHQLLTELRDTIKCICDEHGPFLDVSDNPTQPRATDPFKGKQSGLFFIGKTLYNDTRQPDNLDYSANIVEWSKRHPEVGEFKVAKMEETRFLDLDQIRLGQPYVYQHYGECEHTFQVTDIKMIDARDPQYKHQYPYLCRIPVTNHQLCFICGIIMAQFLVMNSRQHIFDLAFLCEKCLIAYHYVNGKKIGEFKAYRYVQK